MSWLLYQTNPAGEWDLVAPCESLSAAAASIIQLEAIPVRGLFFAFHVTIDGGSDEEALGHFEFKGNRAAYVVRRSVH